MAIMPSSGQMFLRQQAQKQAEAAAAAEQAAAQAEADKQYEADVEAAKLRASSRREHARLANLELKHIRDRERRDRMEASRDRVNGREETPEEKPEKWILGDKSGSYQEGVAGVVPVPSVGGGEHPEDIRVFDASGNVVAEFDPSRRPGTYAPETLGNEVTDRIMAGVEALNRAGIPTAPPEEIRGSVLEMQRQNARSSKYNIDEMFFENELGKWGEIGVEYSSEKHYFLRELGIPGLNEYENWGDVSLAFLKAGNPKDDFARNYAFNENVADIISVLPRGMGLQEYAWEGAVRRDRNLERPPAVSYSEAVRRVNLARHTMGVYGALGSRAPDLVDKRVTEPTPPAGVQRIVNAPLEGVPGVYLTGTIEKVADSAQVYMETGIVHTDLFGFFPQTILTPIDNNIIPIKEEKQPPSFDEIYNTRVAGYERNLTSYNRNLSDYTKGGSRSKEKYQELVAEAGALTAERATVVTLAAVKMTMDQSRYALELNNYLQAKMKAESGIPDQMDYGMTTEEKRASIEQLYMRMPLELTHAATEIYQRTIAEPWKASINRNAWLPAEVAAFSRGGVDVISMFAGMPEFVTTGIAGMEWGVRNPVPFITLMAPVAAETAKQQAEAPIRDPWGQAAPTALLITMFAGGKISPIRIERDLMPTGRTLLVPEGGGAGAVASRFVRKFGVEIPEETMPYADMTVAQRIAVLGRTTQVPETISRLSLRLDPIPMLRTPGFYPVEVQGKWYDVRELAGINIRPRSTSRFSPKELVIKTEEAPHLVTVGETGIEMTTTFRSIVTETVPYVPEVNWLAPSTLVHPSSGLSLPMLSRAKWMLATKSPLWAEFGTPRAMAQFMERPGYVPMGRSSTLGASMMLTSLEERARFEAVVAGEHRIHGYEPDWGVDMDVYGRIDREYGENKYPGSNGLESMVVPGFDIGNDAAVARRILVSELQEINRIIAHPKIERVNDPYLEAKTVTGGLIPKGYESEFLDILKGTDREAYLTGSYAMALQSYTKRVDVPEVDIISDYHQSLGARYADFYNRMYPKSDLFAEGNVKLQVGEDATSVWTRQVLKYEANEPVYGKKFLKRLDIHSQNYGMGWEEWGVKHSYKDIIEINGIRMMPLDALVARKLSTLLAYSESTSVGELLVGAKEGKWKNLADSYAALQSRMVAAEERFSLFRGMEREKISQSMRDLNEMWGVGPEGRISTYPITETGRAEATERFFMESKTGETKGQLLPEYATSFAQGAYYRSLLSVKYGHTVYKNYAVSARGRAFRKIMDVAGIPLSLIPLKIQSRDIPKGASYDLDMVAAPKYGMFGGKISERSSLHALQIHYQNPRLGLQSYLTRTFGIGGEMAALPFEGVYPLATRITKRGAAPIEMIAPSAEAGRTVAAMGEEFILGETTMALTVREYLPRKSPIETVTKAGVVKAAPMPARQARMVEGLGVAESWMFLGKSERGLHLVENVLQYEQHGMGVPAVTREMMTGGSEALAMGYSPLGQGISLSERGIRIPDTSAITEPLLREYTRLDAEYARMEVNRLSGMTGNDLIDRQIQLLQHRAGAYDYLVAIEESMKRGTRAQPVGVRGLQNIIRHVETVPRGMETRIIDIMQRHNLRAQGTLSNLAFQEYGLVKAGDLDLAAATQAGADAAAAELMQVYREATTRGRVPNPARPGETMEADYYVGTTGTTYVVQRYSEHPISLDKTVEILDVSKPRVAGMPQEKAFSVHVEEFGEDLTWGLRSATNPAKAKDVIIEGVRFQPLSEQLMNKATTPAYLSFTESDRFYIGTRPVKSPRFGKDIGDIAGDLTNRYRQMTERGGVWLGYDATTVMKYISDIEKYAITPMHPSVRIYAEGVPTSSGVVSGSSVSEYGKRLTKYPVAGEPHPIPTTMIKVPLSQRALRVGMVPANLWSMYGGTRPIVYGAAAAGIGLLAYSTMQMLPQNQIDLGDKDTYINVAGPLGIMVVAGSTMAFTSVAPRKGEYIQTERYPISRAEKIYPVIAASAMVPPAYMRIINAQRYGEIPKAVPYTRTYPGTIREPNYPSTVKQAKYPMTGKYPVIETLPRNYPKEPRYPRNPKTARYAETVKYPELTIAGYPEPDYPKNPVYPQSPKPVKYPRPPRYPKMTGMYEIPKTVILGGGDEHRRVRRRGKYDVENWYIYNPTPTYETIFGYQLNLREGSSTQKMSLPSVKMPKYKMPRMG